MATPRGITQPHTSFIGSACQGIHHTPVTKHTDTQTNRYKHQNTKKKDTRVHYTVLTQHNPTHNQPQPAASRHEGPTGTTNAAPDTQQCTNEKPLLSRKTGVSTNPNTTQHTPQPGTTITTFDDTATCGYASTRQKQKQWQSHTRRLNHTHPQLWAHKIKAP